MLPINNGKWLSAQSGNKQYEGSMINGVDLRLKKPNAALSAETLGHIQCFYTPNLACLALRIRRLGDESRLGPGRLGFHDRLEVGRVDPSLGQQYRGRGF
jgi:hypothetical protein